MIEEVVTQLADKYLRWWKFSGDKKNLRAPCPFHDEKTEGAFYMSAETGLWLCHSCNARGNLLTFMKEMGAPRTLRATVMDQIGDELIQGSKRREARESPHNDPFKRHMPLKESLLGVFDYCPTDLISAGFDKQVLQEYDIGFDKGAMRITFPIRNHHGVLMAVAGRTVIGDEPRYKIYKEPDLLRFDEDYKGYHFEKKFFLWNMDRVYPRTFRGNAEQVYVVEGYKAALWLIQNGYDNTVALMGTFLSTAQKTLFQRLAATVYLFLDNTADAQASALDIAKQLRPTNRVRLCCYTQREMKGEQPDDLTSQELDAVIKNAITTARRPKDEFHRLRQTLAQSRQETRCAVQQTRGPTWTTFLRNVQAADRRFGLD